MFADELKRQSKTKLAKETSNVRILTIDIETFPNLAYSFNTFKAFIPIEFIVEPSRMACFAAKWLGEKNTMFFSEWQHGRDGMIRAAWDLFEQADIVVTYNGDSFDIPRIQQETMPLGPLAPFKSVDLIKTNRKKFDLPSRKLDYLTGRFLGMGGKMPHEGARMFVGAMNGEAKYLKMFEAYNRRDVVVTERAYLALIPFLVDQPHMGVMIGDGNQHRCAFCGSARLKLHHKKVHAFVRTYNLYRCEACLGWNRSTVLAGEGQFTRPVR
jgi:DNA polymerase elongation subunit (family B)